ncbi:MULTISPECIES: effector-associated domain EAD1-containing protein [Frankia]|uniref:Effector-associated domain-containing protein n=1 Tax=Frankia alni (strain DSM 45986 / CECT 9034 / ACN14a) TaxID=326424 RepID=Q0REK5_FRAAA|nr:MULTISPECIES: effector-associated domain EAD1-containing protein [Frankia]CAJ64103.1 hypothetical protein; putative signal peptide [Frankia alni ACN14a]
MSVSLGLSLLGLVPALLAREHPSRPARFDAAPRSTAAPAASGARTGRTGHGRARTPAGSVAGRSGHGELLRRELARIYTSSAAADQVLARVDYPREQRPSIDYHRPDVAWREIFHDFELGVVADPYRRLLAGALETYGANVVLRDLAHRHGVPVPPARAPLRRITNLKRWLRRPPV